MHIIPSLVIISFRVQIILFVPPGFTFSQQIDSMPLINRLVSVIETGQVRYAVISIYRNVSRLFTDSYS